MERRQPGTATPLRRHDGQVDAFDSVARRPALLSTNHPVPTGGLGGRKLIPVVTGCVCLVLDAEAAGSAPHPSHTFCPSTRPSYNPLYESTRRPFIDGYSTVLARNQKRTQLLSPPQKAVN